MANNAMYRVPDSILNALSGPQGPMGMSPNVNRLSLLPRYSKQEGLVAPQWLYDMARAVEAPGNALMGHQTTPEEAVNFGLNFAGAGLGSSAVMKAPAPGPGKTIAQTVYHGSPHDFDRFDMSKIGTGEGAQAYGHGLYVAESPSVARQYQINLSDGGVYLHSPFDQTRQEVMRRVNDALKYFDSDEFANGPYDPSANARMTDLMRWRESLPKAKDFTQAFGADGKGLAALESAGAKTSDLYRVEKGRFYTVDLPDTAIAQMLDWDAPLSQQPEAVRKALQTPELSGWLERPKATGRDLVAILEMKKGEAGASNYLKSLGIPGIKYFDGNSRSASQGTRNFVVFDDKLLKILNKE